MAIPCRAHMIREACRVENQSLHCQHRSKSRTLSSLAGYQVMLPALS